MRKEPFRRIDPVKDLGLRLLEVEKPARYTGGEYGSLAKPDAGFQTLIAFPDLYEIGMSNQALRIIYNRLNSMEGISCDRAFAPAPDFEALLRETGLPLYGLDTGISLRDTDLLMFTLGYELGITGVLSMLDLAGIPLRAAERSALDPVVIMGGPCVSNPRPYEDFIDAFWIGEAEGGFFDLAGEIRDLKKAGPGRAEILARLLAHPSVWAAGKASARRATDTDFAARPAAAAVFPVSSIKTVHSHGAVEIMRGCPNGCRFCHAGYWYRPMRQKSAETVREEAAAFIREGGYREISLSSLSTGDYRHIGNLVEGLNREYAPLHVSFQLPSLKISSFSLSLLEKVSLTRKSGLTFAVETPEEQWQLGINKRAAREDLVSILREAKKNGWRGAKFYFMLGLPPAQNPAGEGRAGEGGPGEEQGIIDFILDIGRQTGMNFNVTLGAFVPKPHTPFQRAAQIGEDEARRKLDKIRGALKSRGHRAGIQDPFISTLEGLLSRGDGRVGGLIERAYRSGCRLDAWSEFLKKDIWEGIFHEEEALVRETLGPRPGGVPLPWDCIDSGLGPAFLSKEFDRSVKGEFTSPCTENCTHNCGICRDEKKIVYNIIHDDNLLHAAVRDPEKQEKASPSNRVLFSFSKTGPGVFLSHLSLMELFSMAFTRAGIPARYSEGFNPLPRLEIAAPLSLGLAAGGEIALLETEDFFPAEDFLKALSEKLPRGIGVTGAGNFRVPPGAKKHSLSTLLWGFAYVREDGGLDLVKAAEEKKYRLGRSAAGPLERRAVLARFPGGPDAGEPYFDVYRRLYP